MWRRITARNYKSLGDVTVDLAPFTVVVGANGSGKSNLLDVPLFVSDLHRGVPAAIAAHGGAMNLARLDARTPVDIGVRWAMARSGVDGGKEAYEGSFEANGGIRFARERLRTATSVVERTGAELFFGPASVALMNVLPAIDANTSVVTWASTAVEGGARALTGVRRIRPDASRMRAPAPLSGTTEIGEHGENAAPAFSALSSESKARIAQVLARIVPNLDGVDVTTPLDHAYFEFNVRKTRPLGASALSDGALRMLGILIAAEQTTEPHQLLIVEEPEAGVHVGAAWLIYDVLKRVSERAAVAITTHSADLLDIARDEHVLVCESIDGVTHVGELAESQRSLVRDGLMTLGEVMRSETLRIEGAPVPHVEPIE